MQYNITKEELYKLFIEKNLSRKMVAEYYGCAEITIKVKCRKYNIKKSKCLESKNKERKIEKVCPICNSSFYVIAFKSEGRWEQQYCSYSCAYAARKKTKEHRRKLLNKNAAQRRANMKEAMIILNKEEKEQLKQIYLNCPFGYEVDHIKPVSKGGKHHPGNLQYLTIHENRRKYNKCFDQ